MNIYYAFKVVVKEKEGKGKIYLFTLLRMSKEFLQNANSHSQYKSFLLLNVRSANVA